MTTETVGLRSDIPQSILTLSVVGEVRLDADPTATDRFRRHYRVDESGCWLWTGAMYSYRGQETYGQFWFAGRRITAHRASYLIHKGPVDPALDVMHSCNVKACVNPEHLSQGTRSQNLRDAFRDNPGVCAGENNGRARLNWDIVHAIRSGGERTGVLARRYGVSAQQITNVKAGRKWPESSCPIHGAARAESAA